jgi:uncharacterized SAM-binding protein YcdF (DUF218 family)
LTRRLARAGIIALVIVVGWLAGFGWFLHTTSREPTAPPHADGIVALTGGADRVETALRLLDEGHARLLLVSGVGHAADFADLARRAGVDAHLADRVTLGRLATSTRGNAAETAEWVRANDITSLIVVTASYHMPRAMTELSRALPGVILYPDAVTPPALRNRRDGAMLRLLAGEYTKWLAVELGLSSLAPRGDLVVPAGPDRTGQASPPSKSTKQERWG